MARLMILLFLLMALVSVLLLSCKTVAPPTCKHSVMLPVVFQKDSVTFYTMQLPFCDTVSIVPKKKN